MKKLRFAFEREHKGWLLRMWWNWAEVAYLLLALRGLKAEIEFPSDWHELLAELQLAFAIEKRTPV